MSNLSSDNSGVDERLQCAKFFMARYNGLAPIPILVHVIRALVKADLCGDFRSLYAAVKREPSITAHIIAHVTNSPMYPSPSLLMSVDKPSKPVMSIEVAINLMGLKQTKRVLLPLLVQKTFDCSQCKAFNLKRYMMDAISAGYYAISAGEALLSGDNSPAIKTNANDWYTIGLLHNIGLLFMVQHDSQTMTETLSAPNLIDALHSTFGFDYFDLGAVLLKKWGLPAPFYVPLPYIRDPAYRGEQWWVSAALDLARLMISPKLEDDEITTLAEQWGIVLSPAMVDDMDEALDMVNTVID